MVAAHKVLPDVVEVLAVLLQGLLEEHGFRSGPLLHLVPAQDRAPLGHQRGHGFGQVVAVPLQGVHGVELPRQGGRRGLSEKLESEGEPSPRTLWLADGQRDPIPGAK